jgi:hypothetical protein
MVLEGDGGVIEVKVGREDREEVTLDLVCIYLSR